METGGKWKLKEGENGNRWRKISVTVQCCKGECKKNKLIFDICPLKVTSSQKTLKALILMIFMFVKEKSKKHKEMCSSVKTLS